MKGLVLEADWSPRAGYQPSEWEQEHCTAITGSSVWRNPRLVLRDWPDPTPGPHDVVLEVRACGVCGSDMHMAEADSDGYILYPGLTRFPTILGHEFAGRVVELGAQVTTVKVGDMVTAEEMNWCGRCVPCRNGYPNHCANLEEIGFTTPGAFAQYIAVDEKFCWPLTAIAERYGDEELTYDVGALTEPSCVSYNAMFPRAGGFAPGHYVAVFGAGPIGLAAIGLARAAGAGLVAAFEVSEPRRALALQVGADQAFDPRATHASEALLAMSQGQGFDFMVEAAGAPEHTIPEMEKALAINGKIVQIGRAASHVPMYLETFQVRRSQFFGAQGHSGDEVFPNVIRLVAAGRLDLRPIITARYGLQGAVQAFGKMGDRQGGKVLVKPALGNLGEGERQPRRQGTAPNPPEGSPGRGEA